MGLVGNLSDPAPVLPSVVSSVDGALTVTADPVWGGASLGVDFATRVAAVNLLTDPQITDAAAWGTTGGGTADFAGEGALVTDPDGGFATLYPVATVSVTEGVPVTLSFHGEAATGTPSIRAVLQWRDAAGAVVSTLNGATEAAGVGGPVRVHVTGTPPTGATQVRPYLYILNAVAGDQVRMTRAHVTETDALLDYFDGDTPDTVTDRYEWDAAAHASSSTHTAYPTTPHSIRIHRRTPDGQVVAVRGADPNLSPGGISPGYDHEAPLGVPVTWWADALDRDRNVLWTSDEAVLTIPWGSGNGAWVKSLANPSLSRLVYIDQWDEAGRDSRTTTYGIHGRNSPAANLGTPARITATLGLQTRDRADYDAIANLLDSGLLYLDATDDHGISGPLYLVRTGDAPVERPGDLPGWVYRRHVAVVEVIDRPPTTGSPMRNPNASWDSLTYGTWTELGNANPTWLDLANG